MSSCREEILYRQIIRVSKNCARKFGDKYVKSLPISSMFTTINRMKYLTKFHSVYKGDTLCSMAECGNCRKNLTLNLFAASTLRPAKFRTQQLASRVEFTMSHCHDTLAPPDGDGKRRRQIDVAVTPRAGDYGATKFAVGRATASSRKVPDRQLEQTQSTSGQTENSIIFMFYYYHQLLIRHY